MEHFKISSVMIENVNMILKDQYQVDSVWDNDFHAILSRISFVQNHESQMRVQL